MKLFIGTGTDAIKADGYTTVDIEANNQPDIVADAAELSMIADGSAEELHASHVLEHFAWPRSLLVLAEWARVLQPGGLLKLAVPDMELLGAMLAKGQNPFHVMEMVYGAHWLTPGGPQGHHYGYTKTMLAEILTVLGFAEFDWWNSPWVEAANGWLQTDNGEQLGLSINIAARKQSAPLVDMTVLAQRCREQVTEPFMRVVRELSLQDIAVPSRQDIDALLFQRLHFQLLETRHRASILEGQLRQSAGQQQSAESPPKRPRRFPFG